MRLLEPPAPLTRVLPVVVVVLWVGMVRCDPQYYDDGGGGAQNPFQDYGGQLTMVSGRIFRRKKSALVICGHLIVVCHVMLSTT